MQSCIHFMNLKKLNRLAHMRLKKGRDQTHEVSLTEIIIINIVYIASLYFSCL